MSSLDPIISADLVRTRAELAAVSTALASARSEIAAARNEIGLARNEIAAGAASSPIKNVQRGVGYISKVTNSGSRSFTLAIAAVNPAKCAINLLGVEGFFADRRREGSLRLSSATTLEFWMTDPIFNDNVSGDVRYSWEVVEYK
ncbi:hypothetical protein MI467_27630 [Delftia acidovorans]|uniref:hypothetical protein n=1 Tax=Delftia acidovorans TaxID=80866 RepID=UPI001EFCB8D4|nr:hypothetical protein [Delftia acidovorans]MCG8990628.1 hypothetical protein [Delftia acidovorans]